MRLPERVVLPHGNSPDHPPALQSFFQIEALFTSNATSFVL